MDVLPTKVSNMRQASGFTLIELLIAIAVIGVLAGISMPMISDLLGMQQLKGAARYVMGDFMNARMAAVKEHHKTAFVFNQSISVGGATYTADSTHYIFWSDKNNSKSMDAGEIEVRSLGGTSETGKFPRVTITGATFSGGSFEYSSLGTLVSGFGGTLTLSISQGRTRAVIVNSIGSVRVE